MQVGLVAQLLMFMDGVIGLERIAVIATTTIQNGLDPALRRPGRFDLEVRFQPPSEEERWLLLETMLADSSGVTPEEITSLAKLTTGFVAADLHAAVCRAQALSSNGRCTYQKLKSSLEIEQNPGILKRRKQASRVSANWNDIGGYEDVKLALRQALEWPAKHGRAMELFNIRQARGILLHGPPGCCKTTFARIAAKHFRMFLHKPKWSRHLLCIRRGIGANIERSICRCSSRCT